jgi:hypothetical protein
VVGDVMHISTAYTRYRTAARVAAAVVGGAALTGAVQLNAAICLAVCAGALWILSGRPPRALALTAHAAAGAVALYALATLSGAVPDLIDASDRTAAAVAIGLALVGASLATLDVRWSPALPAAGVVAALAFVTLVSSGQEVPDAVVPLSLDLLFLSVGALLARPAREPICAIARDTPGGAVLRRLLPFVFGAPLLLSMFGPESADWLPAAILLALGLLLVRILAREIDTAEEQLRRTAALNVRAERRYRFGDAAARDAASGDVPEEGQLPKSVV